jgi:hypothetical protein
MNESTARYFWAMAVGVALLGISFVITLDVMSRQCHGQCFQNHDKGCQTRCFDKGVCPMAGGDQ